MVWDLDSMPVVYTILFECSWNAQQNAKKVDLILVQVSFMIYKLTEFCRKEMWYKNGENGG